MKIVNSSTGTAVSPKLLRVFLRVLHARGWIIAAFSVLVAAGIYGTTRIPTDSAIERLVVAGDPVAQATLDFEKVFPEEEQALLMLEAPDPSAPTCWKGLCASNATSTKSRMSRRIACSPSAAARVPQRRQPQSASQIRAFATGTTLFQRAGLVGEHYLGIALDLRVGSNAERDRALTAIDSLVLPIEKTGHPFTAIRRVGTPWLDAWLERQTGSATRKFMPLFGIFLMTLVFIVYRSWRTLAAIVITLGAVVAMAVGLADIFGWANTIVSTIVPLTVMVTTTATLVYIHSKYMEPDDAPAWSNTRHGRSPTNSCLAPHRCSPPPSALPHSRCRKFRPVREMGLWTACGLIVAWVSCFTLFPSLQSLFRAPMRSRTASAGKWFPVSSMHSYP